MPSLAPPTTHRPRARACRVALYPPRPLELLPALLVDVPPLNGCHLLLLSSIFPRPSGAAVSGLDWLHHPVLETAVYLPGFRSPLQSACAHFPTNLHNHRAQGMPLLSLLRCSLSLNGPADVYALLPVPFFQPALCLLLRVACLASRASLKLDPTETRVEPRPRYTPDAVLENSIQAVDCHPP